jgi:hypothetical protein
MVRVEVKWNKQVFGDVDVNVSQPVAALKAQLEALTGVPPGRQKLMAKGGWKGILKDEEDLSKLTLAEGQKITLMGSAEVVVKPKEAVVFIEDMKESDLAETGVTMPAGLVNLGNTCYMNSTLQCLRKVPELRNTLASFRTEGGGAGDAARGNLNPTFTVALRDTLDVLDRSTDAVPPAMFLQVLRGLYPQFDERGPRGAYMQQDAEELYSSLLNALAQTLRDPAPVSFKPGDDALYVAPDGSRHEVKIVAVHHDDSPPYYTIRLPKKAAPGDGKGKAAGSEAASAAAEGEEKQTDLAHLEKEGGSLKDLGGAQNVIDALFGIELEQELTCQECPEEAKVVKYDSQRKLVCNIQGGAGAATQIGHMHEGIKLGLVGEVEKHSEILGRNAMWTKTSRIKKLPRYICVQFMRFFWKATPNSQDHAGVKCKIMRPITFPNVMDVYEFCNDSLKATLDKPRAVVEDEILGKKRSADGDAAATEEKKEEEVDMEVDDEEAAALKAAIAMSMDAEAKLEDVLMKDGAAGPGLPASFKGNYEVCAVVTHKGREADGGHYMGWVRQSGDDWLVFDDSDVSPCKTEDIMNLKGGGDWHMAYLTLWRYKD